MEFQAPQLTQQWFRVLDKLKYFFEVCETELTKITTLVSLINEGYGINVGG